MHLFTGQPMKRWSKFSVLVGLKLNTLPYLYQYRYVNTIITWCTIKYNYDSNIV